MEEKKEGEHRKYKLVGPSSQRQKNIAWWQYTGLQDLHVWAQECRGQRVQAGELDLTLQTMEATDQF